MKIFQKMFKIGPQGAPTRGGAKNFQEIFFKYENGPSVQISWTSDTRNKSSFNNHCKEEDEDEDEEDEEHLKRIWNPAAQGKNYTIVE